MIRALTLALMLLAALPARADDSRLDQLFTALARADDSSWQGIEDQIWEEWSQSGSPAMDLLLERGREALAAGDAKAAIEHLTALTENAPDFAEGWNALATAYFEAGQYGLAVGDIGHVLTLEPRHFGALTGLAVILEEVGDREGALRAYRAALAIHPFRPDLREAADRLEDELQGTSL